MSRVKDFVIHVGAESQGVTQRSFSTVLVVSHEMDVEYREIKSMEDIKDLEQDSKTYDVLKAIFSQSPMTATVMLAGKSDLDSKGQVDLLKKLVKQGKEFYFVATSDNSTPTIKAVAEYIGTQTKQYMVTTDDVDFENDIQLDNVALFVHPKGERVGEGLIVEMCTKTGGKTAMFKQVKGINPAYYSSEEITYLENNNMNMYIKNLGVSYVREGKQTDGSYIDVGLGKHWVTFRLEEDMLQYFVNADNVDYSNDGISEMIDVVEKRCKLAKEQGIFEDYSISYRKKQEIPKTDLANRKYNYIHVQGVLKGAIHGGEINVYMVL